MSKPKKEFLFRIMDGSQNILTKYVDGTITLYLKTEDRERHLGYSDKENFYVNRKDEHIFHKSDSFGFNYYVIFNSKFTHVIINHEQTYYKVPKSVIKEFGKVMNFKNAQDGNSFELQIFLKLEIIRNYTFIPDAEKINEVKEKEDGNPETPGAPAINI